MTRRPVDEGAVTRAGAGASTSGDAGPGDAGADTDHETETEIEAAERPLFPHPPWTVGLVLVAGGITLLFGILVSPIWLVVGSPFLIALFLWLYIRLVVRPDESG